MNSQDTSNYEFTILLNEPKNKEIPIMRNLAVFKSSTLSFSVPIDDVTSNTSEFEEYISQCLYAAQDTEHLLFVFISDVPYAKNEYFLSFLAFIKNLFVYDITENAKDLGVYSAEDILNQQFEPLYSYLELNIDKSTLRASLIYLDNTEYFPLLEQELRNVFTGAKHSSYLSQVSHVFGILSDSVEVDFEQKAASLLYNVKEMHLLRVARKEAKISLDEMSNCQYNKKLALIAFKHWREKEQMLLLLQIFIKNYMKIYYKCSFFLICCGNYDKYVDFEKVKQLRYELRMNARKLHLQIVSNDIAAQLVEKPPLDLQTLTEEQIQQNAAEISSVFQMKYKPFGRLVKYVLRESIPFLESQWAPPVDLYVNVYHIISSDIPSKLGIGIYHSAVNLGAVELAFGGHPYPNETGVFFTKAMKMGNGARFFKQQYVGKCYLHKLQVYEEIMRRIPIWQGTKYDLLHCNCNDFTDEMCIALTGERLPSYVNRAAKIGGVFKKSKIDNLGTLEAVVQWQCQEEETESEDECEDQGLRDYVM